VSFTSALPANLAKLGFIPGAVAVSDAARGSETAAVLLVPTPEPAAGTDAALLALAGADAARGADRLLRAVPVIPVRFTGVPYAPATAADALLARAAAIVAQKQKYHAKLLSPEGEMTTLMRFVEVAEDYSRLAAALLPEYLVSGLGMSLLFWLSPAEIEPLSLEFAWRLPSPDEWLKGVSVVLERLSPEISVELLQLSAALEELAALMFKERVPAAMPGVVTEAAELPVLETIIETAAEKCVFDRSRYGSCYLDPDTVREIIRNALLNAWRKHGYMPGRRAEVEPLAAAADIAPEIPEYVINRIAVLVYGHLECMALGYGVLGVSRLCEGHPERPGWGRYPWVDYRGEYGEVALRHLADMSMGFVLGVSPLGLAFLTSEVDPFRDVVVELAPGAPEPGGQAVVRAVVERLRRFGGRALLAPAALANYVTAEEAADPLRCERTETWGQLMAYARAVDAVAERVAAELRPDASAFELKQYAAAARQLLGHLAKRHRWGHAVYRMMSDEELRRYWVEYWSRHGLDPQVLSALFDRIIGIVRDLAREKKELARRPRLARLGIPLDTW
jgi:hypothetical protein